MEGRYANHFEIGFSAHEFVLDFGQAYEANEQPRMHTRIVTSPASAKDLLTLLTRSVTEFEKEHGTIRASGSEMDE